MASPKHLWSGDWKRESAAARAAAAAARPGAAGSAPPPVEPPARADPSPPVAPPAGADPRPATEPRPRRTAAGPAAAPSPAARPAASWLRRRVLLVAVIGALVLVGGAWALSSGGGPNGSVAGLEGALPYLGLNLQSVPVNRVIVQAVVPSSPADQAGIGPGDLLLSLDGHQVASPGDVNRILAGLHPGDSVTLRLEQGPVAITAQVQLADSPAATP